MNLVHLSDIVPAPLMAQKPEAARQAASRLLSQPVVATILNGKVVSGLHRLKARLMVIGTAEVRDSTTMETYTVRREIDGGIVRLKGST